MIYKFFIVLYSVFLCAYMFIHLFVSSTNNCRRSSERNFWYMSTGSREEQGKVAP